MASFSAGDCEGLRASMWLCPVCGSRLICEHGHSFDRAKQGYLNLLLAHRKHSASPGDDRQMVNSRREFLERGYYRPLAERLGALCIETMSSSAGDFALLDTGCGEGYYTCAIADGLRHAAQQRGLWIGGIDISRHAIGLAARRCKTAEFAVASNASIPVADASLDCLLQIFAPGYDDEILRGLKPGGCFIVVTPGPRHLFALRELVYDEAREHTAAIKCPPGLQHRERIDLAFSLCVQQGDIAKLLCMTPYFWKVSKNRQHEIAEMEMLQTDACFVVDIFDRPVQR